MNIHSKTRLESFEALRGAPTVLLTSFKRSGEGAGTPISFVIDGNRLYFATRDSTWKVKRMANNPRVTLAPCTRQGKVTGPAIDGIARRLDGADAIRARAVMTNSWGRRLWGLMFVLLYKVIAPRDKWLMYQVTPVPRTTKEM